MTGKTFRTCQPQGNEIYLQESPTSKRQLFLTVHMIDEWKDLPADLETLTKGLASILEEYTK